MTTCKNCGNPIQSHSGRRPREFCDNNQKCRNEWFRKNKKVETHKIIPMEEWKEIKEQLNKVSLIPLMDIEEVKKMVDAYGNRSKDDIERELGQSNLQNKNGRIDRSKIIVELVDVENSDFKPQETGKTEKQASVSKKEKEAPVAPENNNEGILEQIKAIQLEKIPKERDTLYGRKAWNIDQYKRIEELKSKLTP